MINYIKTAIDDLVFLRIVMVLWTLPLFGIALYSILNVPEFCPAYWLLVLPIGAFVLGAWLLYSAVFADDKAFEKRIDYLSEGGDLAGIVFVVVVLVLAVPLYELHKFLRRTNTR